MKENKEHNGMRWLAAQLRRLLRCLSAPLTKNPIWFMFAYLWGSTCNVLVVWNSSRLIGFLHLFMELYLLTALLTALPRVARSITKALLSITFCLLGIVDVFCYYKLGMPITPTLLNTFMQTDSGEATEALGSYLTDMSAALPVAALTAVAAFFAFMAAARGTRKAINGLAARFQELTGSMTAIALTAALSLSAGNGIYLFHKLVLGESEKEIHESTGISPTVRLYTPVHRFMNAVTEYRKERSTIDSMVRSIGRSTVEGCTFLSPNIVLVIGESYSRHHSQLYGYGKETTPYQCGLANDSNFVVFEDAIASWNLTYDVMKNMLSVHCPGDTGEWHQYPLFTTLFRNAGYHVTLLSNQFVMDGSTYSDFQENMLLNDMRMSEAQFDRRNGKRHAYDEELLAWNDTASGSEYQGRLTIYHLMGQHIDFKERYPGEWERFTPEMYPGLPDEDAATAAHYDNATLYNDHVLHRIVEMYEGTESIIIHLADHGERSGTRGNGHGRRFTFEAEDIEEQYEIPFWIYMTKEYAARHSDIKERIEAASKKPICTDNVAHMLLSLAGISKPYYNSLYDPLAAGNGMQQPRMIWERFNYDKWKQTEETTGALWK